MIEESSFSLLSLIPSVQSWVFFLPPLPLSYSLPSRSSSAHRPAPHGPTGRRPTGPQAGAPRAHTSMRFSPNTRHGTPHLSNPTQAVLQQALPSSTASALFPPVPMNTHCSVHHSEPLPAAQISARRISASSPGHTAKAPTSGKGTGRNVSFSDALLRLI